MGYLAPVWDLERGASSGLCSPTGWDANDLHHPHQALCTGPNYSAHAVAGQWYKNEEEGGEHERTDGDGVTQILIW